MLFKRPSEKIFANHNSDKRLVFRMYKEHSKLNSKKQHSRKWVKDKNLSLKRTYRWHLAGERWSTSLVTGEMQTKITEEVLLHTYQNGYNERQ